MNGVETSLRLKSKALVYYRIGLADQSNSVIFENILWCSSDFGEITEK